MNAYPSQICLIYHFLETALFSDVSAFFWFFLLIINMESHSVAFISTNEKRLQNQVFRQIKSKLIWMHLDLAKLHCLKGLNSPYIVSYLHFLNLNNILTLPKLLSSLKLGLIWHDICLPYFLSARFTHMRTSLRNQNKCKPSIWCLGVSKLEHNKTTFLFAFWLVFFIYLFFLQYLKPDTHEWYLFSTRNSIMDQS